MTTILHVIHLYCGIGSLGSIQCSRTTNQMALGWTLLFQRLVTRFLYRFVRLLFSAEQRVYWELNGTARRLREASDPRHYETSAHVLDVLIEHHFCDNQNMTVENFLCVHNRFDSPRFVIESEHVTLLTINEKNAVFGVAREKGKLQLC
jgi:hypothetical protein